MAPIAKADTECRPIRSLDELRAWKRPDYADRFPVPPVAPRSAAVSVSSLSKSYRVTHMVRFVHNSLEGFSQVNAED